MATPWPHQIIAGPHRTGLFEMVVVGIFLTGVSKSRAGPHVWPDPVEPSWAHHLKAKGAESLRKHSRVRTLWPHPDHTSLRSGPEPKEAALNWGGLLRSRWRLQGLLRGQPPRSCALG